MEYRVILQVNDKIDFEYIDRAATEKRRTNQSRDISKLEGVQHTRWPI